MDGPYTPDTSRWMPTDVNADGRSDLVYVDYKYRSYCPFTHGCPSPYDRVKHPYASGIRIYTILASESGHWEARVEFFPDDLWQGANIEDSPQWKPMDVDGDGKVDLVHIHHSLGRNPGLHVTTLFSKGDGKWTPVFPDPLSDITISDTANLRPMDVNGDGKMDLVHVYNPPSRDVSSSPTCIHTLLSDFVYDKKNDLFRGDWIHRPDPQKSDEVCLNLSIYDTLNWQAADVNADGKADLVHVGQDPTSYFIDTLLSTGSGNHWQAIRGTAGTGNWPDTPNWKPADVNGDGRTDLVHVQALMHDQATFCGTERCS